MEWEEALNLEEWMWFVQTKKGAVAVPDQDSAMRETTDCIFPGRCSGGKGRGPLE